MIAYYLENSGCYFGISVPQFDHMTSRCLCQREWGLEMAEDISADLVSASKETTSVACSARGTACRWAEDPFSEALIGALCYVLRLNLILLLLKWGVMCSVLERGGNKEASENMQRLLVSLYLHAYNSRKGGFSFNQDRSEAICNDQKQSSEDWAVSH